MASKIGAVFGHIGQKGTYDYDFGSTTRLTVELTGARVGRISKHAVRLLVRNDPLPWKCGICGEPATLVCCAHESDDSPFVCDAHEAEHECGDATLLPVVNSPRMGVCGYADRLPRRLPSTAQVAPFHVERGEHIGDTSRSLADSTSSLVLRRPYRC